MLTPSIFAITIPATLETAKTIQKVLAWAKDNPPLVALFGVVLGGFLTTVVWPVAKMTTTTIIDAALSTLGGKKLEHAYLDWMVRQHRFLPSLPSTLVPVTSGAHLQELDDIYVSLSMADKDTVSITIDEAISKYSRLIILGDPGSGKTTMLRFLTLTFARACRAKTSSKDRIDAQKERQRVRAARLRVRANYKMTDKPLPIFIYLNRLRNVVNWPDGHTILDAIYDDWQPINTTRVAQREFIEKRIKEGRCIFLFDAFDELGSHDARERVAVKLGEFCAQMPEGNRFVVTSRIVGYQGQLDMYGFQPLKIQRLSWDMTTTLVNKWYDSLGQPELSPRLLDVLSTSPRLNDLATNPMLLSLIVLVQYVLPLIPDKRHVLYEECLKILVERRYAPPRIQMEFNNILPADEAISILRSIAALMHKGKLREIPRSVLESQVIPAIIKEMDLSKAGQNLPGDILANIELRSQLLTERGISDRGEALMAFSHMTFQEYLVSKEFHADMPSRGKAMIMNDVVNLYNSDPDWWEEVALLFAAQLENRDQQPFFDLLRPQNLET